jgi:hypothetical protein
MEERAASAARVAAEKRIELCATELGWWRYKTECDQPLYIMICKQQRQRYSN